MQHAGIWDGRSASRPPVAYSMDQAEQAPPGLGMRQADVSLRHGPPLPNYVVGALIVLLLAVMIFAAQTFYWKGQVDVQIENIKELKALVDELRIYNEHSRGEFRKHGWLVDEKGNVSKAGPAKQGE